MKTLVLAIGLLVLSAIAGCGGDDDTPSVDAATPDALVDASTAPDATVVTRCETMCTCAVANCPGFEMNACVTECEMLPSSAQSCRLEHCGYAKSNPTFHCPHVRGDPGSPQECIAPD